MIETVQKARHKASRGAIVSRWIIRIIMALWAIITVFPLIWAFYSSFKSNTEFLADPWALPKVLHFENYVYAWTSSKIYNYFFNSIFVVVGALLLTLIMATTSAYIVAKYKHKFVACVRKFYMIFMMVPQILLLVPLYFQCIAWGIDDNLWILILLYALQGLPFSIFILTPFMVGINDSILESAQMDGANEFQIFIAIIAPMAKSAIFVASLMSIVGSWNEYVMALTFIKTEALYTIPIGISYLSSASAYNTQYGGLFAGLIIAMIPMMIVYSIFQKPLQEGLSASDGVKG